MINESAKQDVLNATVWSASGSTANEYGVRLLNDCYKYSLAINNHLQRASVSTRTFNHVIVINTA